MTRRFGPHRYFSGPPHDPPTWVMVLGILAFLGVLLLVGAIAAPALPPAR